MDYEINDTKAYHICNLNTLGWELTVCNALDPEISPCRRILKRNDSYGHLLYDFLMRFIPLQSLKKVIEIGGGYGYLMRDFLDRNGALQAVMLDISPCLMQKQRDILGNRNVDFRQANIMEVDPDALRSFELAILNETLGDLPTLAGVHRDVFLLSPLDLDETLQRLRRIYEQYALNLPQRDTFNVNIGALEVLEKLCHAGIPYIFMSEHSCEAAAPEPMQRFLQIRPTVDPERIRLKGHDEYTIRFSDLEKMALAFRYKVFRGPFADFLEFDLSDKVRYIMASRSSLKDEHEIIRHFVEDLYQYEYLILVGDKTKHQDCNESQT